MDNQLVRDLNPGSDSTASLRSFLAMGIHWTRVLSCIRFVVAETVAEVFGTYQVACLSHLSVLLPFSVVRVVRTVVAKTLSRRADLRIVANITTLVARTTRERRHRD